MGKNRDDVGCTPSELERMDAYGRRVMLEAKHGRLELAKQLIDQFVAEDQAADERCLETIRLAEVLTDQLVVNVLDRQFGCLSVGDLLEVMPQALVATPNIGVSRVLAIYQQLAGFAVRKCRVQGTELAVLRHQHDGANGILRDAV